MYVKTPESQLFLIWSRVRNNNGLKVLRWIVLSSDGSPSSSLDDSAGKPRRKTGLSNGTQPSTRIMKGKIQEADREATLLSLLNHPVRRLLPICLRSRPSRNSLRSRAGSLRIYIYNLEGVRRVTGDKGLLGQEDRVASHNVQLQESITPNMITGMGQQAFSRLSFTSQNPKPSSYEQDNCCFQMSFKFFLLWASCSMFSSASAAVGSYLSYARTIESWRGWCKMDC